MRGGGRCFDLLFEGKEEKVVIDSLLFIPPPYSLSSLLSLMGEVKAQCHAPARPRTRLYVRLAWRVIR